MLSGFLCSFGALSFGDFDVLSFGALSFCALSEVKKKILRNTIVLSQIVKIQRKQKFYELNDVVILTFQDKYIYMEANGLSAYLLYLFTLPVVFFF